MVPLSFTPYPLFQWYPPSKEINGCAQQKGTRETKLVEKLVWVPVILFYKISFPITHLTAYYAKTGHSRPLIA
jgi:hypothetical protein